MSANKKINMLEGSLWDRIVIFALPLAFTGMLQQLYNAADVAVLGRFVSDLAVAAVGNNVPVIGYSEIARMGLALGVNVVVARALGMKNDRKASEAVRTSFLLRCLWCCCSSYWAFILGLCHGLAGCPHRGERSRSCLFTCLFIRHAFYCCIQFSGGGFS